MDSSPKAEGPIRKRQLQLFAHGRRGSIVQHNSSTSTPYAQSHLLLIIRAMKENTTVLDGLKTSGTVAPYLRVMTANTALTTVKLVGPQIVMSRVYDDIVPLCSGSAKSSLSAIARIARTARPDTLCRVAVSANNHISEKRCLLDGGSWWKLAAKVHERIDLRQSYQTGTPVARHQPGAYLHRRLSGSCSPQIERSQAG